MNNFRASVFSGKPKQEAETLLGAKKLGVHPHSLSEMTVPRDVARTTNHRDDDRHRLAGERAWVHFRGESVNVELINLSGGGAMIATDIKPRMWERVDLVLGEHGALECAVRWIRDDRIGLEFAHETQVGGDPMQRDAMLLDVIRRSFPDLPIAAPDVTVFEGQAPAEPLSDEIAARRTSSRHPLIWKGSILFQHDTIPVRLRNISPDGALLDIPHPLPTDCEVYLDLGAAGSLFANVSWSRGNQLGVRFADRFDIAQLAKLRPDLAPQRWASPDYLREDQGDGSPWAEQWNRQSVEELKNSLEGFLKY